MNLITEMTHPLIVPVGSELMEGALYARLWHGRNDPSENLECWGFNGPLFGPISSFHQTYLTTTRLVGREGGGEIWIEHREDLFVWAGCYYGDIAVYVAKAGEIA